MSSFAPLTLGEAIAQAMKDVRQQPKAYVYCAICRKKQTNGKLLAHHKEAHSNESTK